MYVCCVFHAFVVARAGLTSLPVMHVMGPPVQGGPVGGTIFYI